MARLPLVGGGLGSQRAKVPAGDVILPIPVVIFSNGATQTDLNNMYGSGTHPPLDSPLQIMAATKAGNFNEAAGFFGLNVLAGAQSSSQEVALYAFAQDNRASVSGQGGVWAFNPLVTVNAANISAYAVEADVNNLGGDCGNLFAGPATEVVGVMAAHGGTKRPFAAFQAQALTSPWVYGLSLHTNIVATTTSTGATVNFPITNGTVLTVASTTGWPTTGFLDWGGVPLAYSSFSGLNVTISVGGARSDPGGFGSVAAGATVRVLTPSVWESGAAIISMSGSPNRVEYETHLGLQVHSLFQFNTQGKLQWGAPDGSTAPDTNLYRQAPSALQTDGAFFAAGELQARQGAATQVRIGAAGPGSESAITFQSGEAGSNLYRSAAGTLQTDGLLLLKQQQGVRATPAYSASITPDASAGPWQTITVTNATAFTINAPTSPPSSSRSAELTIEVLNSSGGAMGVITWNAAFVFPTGAWANPANTKRRFARFEWNGSSWICTALASSDY